MNLNPIHPKYHFAQQFISIFLLLLFFFPFSMPLFKLFKPYVTFKYEAIFLACMAFLAFNIIMACLISLIVKEFYKHIHFKILNDRVEYYRDFVGLHIKDLKYKNVKEMSLRQNPIQKLFGVGTILLQSHASPQTSKAGSSGLKINNIENPQKIYSFLKKEIDKAESN